MDAVVEGVGTQYDQSSRSRQHRAVPVIGERDSGHYPAAEARDSWRARDARYML
jgi:hypothetical protein